MKVLFTAHQEDATACAAIATLARYPSVLLSPEKVAEPHCIGLFSVDELPRHRCLRMARYHMGEKGIVVPWWAEQMPFLVALSNSAHQKRPDKFREALLRMVQDYEFWSPNNMALPAPGHSGWKGKEPPAAYVAWHGAAVRALAALAA